MILFLMVSLVIFIVEVEMGFVEGVIYWENVLLLVYVLICVIL